MKTGWEAGTWQWGGQWRESDKGTKENKRIEWWVWSCQIQSSNAGI